MSRRWSRQKTYQDTCTAKTLPPRIRVSIRYDIGRNSATCSRHFDLCFERTPTVLVPRSKKETQNSKEKDDVMGYYVFVIACGDWREPIGWCLTEWKFVSLGNQFFFLGQRKRSWEPIWLDRKCFVFLKKKLGTLNNDNEINGNFNFLFLSKGNIPSEEWKMGTMCCDCRWQWPNLTLSFSKS